MIKLAASAASQEGFWSRDPVGCPGTLVGLVNAREWLEGHRRRGAVRQAAAEVVPIASHGERGCADRAAKVEGEDLASRIAPELKRDKREQDGLARAGRSDNQRVTDIADMQRKAKRRAAFGLAVKQRRRTKMLVPFRPCPDRRERNHVGEV